MTTSVNNRSMCSGELPPIRGRFSVIRFEYSVAVFLEHSSGQAAHDVVVLNEQDRSALPLRADVSISDLDSSPILWSALGR